MGCTYGDLVGATFRKGRGCAYCRHTGYKGRIAAFEMLIPEVHVRDAVLERKTTHELRELSLDNAGLISLLEDGIVEAAIGRTTWTECCGPCPGCANPGPWLNCDASLECDHV